MPAAIHEAVCVRKYRWVTGGFVACCASLTSWPFENAVGVVKLNIMSAIDFDVSDYCQTLNL